MNLSTVTKILTGFSDCPNCGKTIYTTDLTVDENSIILSCNECGWTLSVSEGIRSEELRKIIIAGYEESDVKSDEKPLVSKAKNIGERIREIRRYKRMTLKEVAEAANLSVTSIANYEHFRRTPDVLTLADISKALGVSLTDFLQGIKTGEE